MQKSIRAFFLLGVFYLLAASSSFASIADVLMNKNKQANQPLPVISAYEYRHYSTVLQQNRRYFVALPARYHMNYRQYPTLYIVDADFQFQHVAAVVKNLARMGKIPPMIVVGIANQGDDDYLKQTTWPVTSDEAFGGAEQFQQYLSKELVPLIDDQFQTNNKKALSGYSLGGLFTLFSMMQQNTPFNVFLAMSPSAWYDDYQLMTKITSSFEQKTLKKPVFLSVAKEQEMGGDKLVDVFNRYAPKSLNWQFKHYPNENHFTTALPALYDGLQFLAPNYATDGSDMMALGDYHQVLAHFKTLQQQWAGFQFEWLQAYQFAKYVFWSKQTAQTDDILLAVAEQFPESKALVTIELAKGFNKKQQHERAKNLLDSVEQQGLLMPGWHKQMRIYWQSKNQTKRAEQHQSKAIALAKQYQFESWEVWELK